MTDRWQPLMSPLFERADHHAFHQKVQKFAIFIMKIIMFLLVSSAVAFVAPAATRRTRAPLMVVSARNVEASRADFLANSAVLTTLSTLIFVPPSEARGRATLEQSYDRRVLSLWC